MRLGDLGEFSLIERLAALLGDTAGVTLGIGDDAAVLAVPAGAEVVFTLDTVVEGVHFRRDWSDAGDIGWKALAVNVSDLGAMGATPLGALVSLALPAETDVAWIEALYAGLGECAAEYGCPIVGGDTVRGRVAVISVAALGSAPAGRAVTRSGARAGDLVCVTGTLGAGAAGMALLERGDPPAEFAALVEAHRRPRPPKGAGVALAGIATAMLDLSDGLASDLQRLRERSGVAARIEALRLPIADATRRAAAAVGVNPLEWSLHGGEDFELLFTVAEERFGEVPPALGPLGVAATIIGEATEGDNLLVNEDGVASPLTPRGFRHFGQE